MSPVLFRAASRMMLRVGVGVLGMVEEIEADARGVPAEDGEVDAVAARMGAERKRHARADGLNLAQAGGGVRVRQVARAFGCWTSAASVGIAVPCPSGWTCSSDVYSPDSLAVSVTAKSARRAVTESALRQNSMPRRPSDGNRQPPSPRFANPSSGTRDTRWRSPGRACRRARCSNASAWPCGTSWSTAGSKPSSATGRRTPSTSITCRSSTCWGECSPTT